MSIPKKIRGEVHKKFDAHCAYCGKEISMKEMQVDHLLPQRLGGGDEIENLMPSCRRCNHYKRANSLETFRKMIEEIPRKLIERHYIFNVGLDYDLIKINEKKVEFYFEKSSSISPHSPEKKEEWIPISKKFPEAGVKVNVTLNDGRVTSLWWSDLEDVWTDNFQEYLQYEVVAWKPLPEPYRKEHGL